MWLNCGRLAAQRANWPAAVVAYQHALRIQPTNGRAHFQLSLILRKMGDRTQASAHLRAAARALPGNLEVQAALDALRASQPGAPQAIDR